jgi:hypothetical protein
MEKLASRGLVIIQKKGSEWVVEFIRKNEAWFLVDRQTEWGRELGHSGRDRRFEVNLLQTRFYSSPCIHRYIER